MSSSILKLVVPLLLPLAVNVLRVTDDPSEEEMPAEEETPPPLESQGYCCCKKEECTTDARSSAGTDAVYNPNQGLCCKMKRWRCNFGFGRFSGYKIKAESLSYCDKSKPQDQAFLPAQVKAWCANGIQGEDGTCCPSSCGTCGGEDCESRGSACCSATAECASRYETGCKVPEEDDATIPPPASYEPGTVGHTVYNYCNFSNHVDIDESDAEGSNQVKHKLVKQIVDQMDDNSIDKMAKSMFTIYMCVRWVPTPRFASMAEAEMRTEQMEEKEVLEHYEGLTFMPLKCTENMAVYDNKGSEATFFEKFEAELNAQKNWYLSEKEGVLNHRLQEISKARSKGDKEKVEERTRAFDLAYVKEKANCEDTSTGNVLVDTFKATAEEMLSDCKAAKWWLTKLSDWHRSMPFDTFMTPSADLDEEAKPGDTEQVMMCFGKRVASELHRRKMGGHLMTDQSAVGCHGFYDFSMASKMVDRIVSLWRPPTCQLAALLLDFKVKILQMMEDMNDRLFDALPSLILEEETGITNWDGKRLQPAGSLGVLAGIWKSIAERFNFFKTKYTRLGALLGGTMVKWVVCPLNAITNQTELDTLDSVLGSEDHVARYYSKIANQRHTGAKDVLPGQSCTDPVPGLERARMCVLGTMSEDTPEPYKNDHFLCPVTPLMPAKAQLDVLEAKENKCFLHMNLPQISQQHWYYHGHVPSNKQYNATENIPLADYEAAKIISYRRRPDADFNIFRTFAKIGLGCTEHENEITPRWCTKPEILNDGEKHRNLLTGLALPKFSGIPNEATSERMGEWLYRRFKGSERWWRRTSTEWVGRASRRYNKLEKKSFLEVEAAELLHSMSFQKLDGDSGGDSKGNHKYTRYVAEVPCDGFDPEREFELKYQWGEYGLQLLRKARNDWNKKTSALQDSSVVVELRGDAVFNMRDESNAWMVYLTHIRVFGGTKEETAFIPTNNPIMTSLSGALDPARAARVRASDLRGFRATFACGTKLDMHDLDKVTTFGHGDFQKCVNEGVKTNEELRKNHPEKTFLENEIVVRMVISELPACYSELDPNLVQTANETENHAYSNFLAATEDCLPISGEIPEDLAAAKEKKEYRGMLYGNGMPPDTLKEVLMDPEDVKREARL